MATGARLVAMGARRPSIVRVPALGWFIVLLLWCGGAGATARDDAERIYRDGVLPSGEPLRGVREAGVPIQGRAAACANCHRRSGIGVNEGRITIPPISGKYLLRPGERPLPESSSQSPASGVVRHDRYNDATLTRAIREGINADGKPLSYLMPRFALSDADSAALVDYLKSLSSEPVPGVTPDDLHLATIVTPDADPAERAGMIDVLEHFFSNKNDFERGHDPPLVSARRIHYRVVRKWRLHVWELTGAPDTWEQQLRDRFRTEPVFAVVSGVGGRDWAPVHRFCERQAVPCLFPNVQLPVVAEGDFYPLYFSRGVLLEADLIRARLRQPASGASGSMLQVYRRGDIGEAAAQALRGQTGSSAFDWIDRPLPAVAGDGDLRQALASVRAGDTLVLWLRGDDLRELPADPPPSVAVFASGLMAGLENAPLPANWRGATLVTYPVDPPQRRAVRLVAPLTWFRTQKVPIVAERVQVDTYVACQVLSEAVGHAYGDLVPDYVIEQIENMVSLKLLNGYYPRLGLAPGQRFASKGGYLVHLPAASGAPVVADGDWVVP
jgi:Cytochrome c